LNFTALHVTFLQHLSQKNEAHTVSFENLQRLLEFTSLHTFSNDLICRAQK